MENNPIFDKWNRLSIIQRAAFVAVVITVPAWIYGLSIGTTARPDVERAPNSMVSASQPNPLPVAPSLPSTSNFQNSGPQPTPTFNTPAPATAVSNILRDVEKNTALMGYDSRFSQETRAVWSFLMTCLVNLRDLQGNSYINTCETNKNLIAPRNRSAFPENGDGYWLRTALPLSRARRYVSVSIFLRVNGKNIQLANGALQP